MVGCATAFYHGYDKKYTSMVDSRPRRTPVIEVHGATYCSTPTEEFLLVLYAGERFRRAVYICSDRVCELLHHTAHNSPQTIYHRSPAERVLHVFHLSELGVPHSSTCYDSQQCEQNLEGSCVYAAAERKERLTYIRNIFNRKKPAKS